MKVISRKKLCIVLLISLIAFAALVVTVVPVAPATSRGTHSTRALNSTGAVTVHAAGQGNPWINLSDGREALTDYAEAAESRQALEQNPVRSLALASADLDKDGASDPICLERMHSALMPSAWASLNASAAPQQPPVITVSAASYEAAITPDSIVAAFGTRLATTTAGAGDADPGTPGLQLPTELGGTTVEVDGQRAGLFFVSPEQVNYLIPANTKVGTANVDVRAGDGTVSHGTAQVNAVAPAIFTANSSGRGRPAALLYLVRADGQLVIEPLADRPISFGPDERAILALFLSGIRRAPDPDGDGNLRENVHMVIGGAEVIPDYAGRQADFVGLDQINVTLPHNLSGRGRVNLSIAGRGFAASNLAEIEIGSGAGSAPPSVSGFAPAPLLAGQMLQISGSGFAASPAETTVRLGGIEARLVSASVSQLAVQAPFGAKSGPVSVRTPQGEGTSKDALRMRTSLSGFIENTSRQPLSGVKVRVAGTSITAQTGAEGSFILPDVSPGATVIEVDSSAVAVTPPFPRVVLKTIVGAEQDNPFPRPLSLQQATGASISLGSGSAFAEEVSIPAPTIAHEITETIQTGNVTFEVPGNATVRFPDGATSGVLTLTLVENSRTPVNLPPGLFSSVIVQISPFGATINPGGKLTFPNPDGFPAGAQISLFRLDQVANSPSLGNFIEAGTATVSADGQRIETAANAVTETSYYFVSSPQLTTTVVGRVVDGDGRTPVRLALVRVRGQETFTDGNGSFVLRQIALKSEADQLTAEASYVRPSGRVDRVQRDNVPVVVNGITTVTPDLVLPAETSNRPPVIICPPNLALNARDTSNITCAVYDPDPGQTVEVTISGVSFATLSKGSNDSCTLRLTPGPNDLGDHMLTMTATDNQGAVTTHKLALKVAPTTISCGQTRTASLASVAQRDTYTFIGKANDVVLITAKGTGAGGVCAFAEVRKPDNTLLIRPPCNTSSRVSLPSDGTYTILIYDADFNDTGGYNLNLQFADGRCGAPLGCGQTVRTSLTSITQHHIYTLTGKANDLVIITAKGTGAGGVCAVAEVYKPDSTLLIRLPCNTNNRLTLPMDGAYTIVVYDSGLNDTGGYDLSLQFADGRCGTPIRYGQTLNVSLTSITQHHIYTFRGNANQLLDVITKGSGAGGVCAVAEVYKPDGMLLKAAPCNQSTGDFMLPLDGNYTIVVYDSGLNDTGGYSINLTCIGANCSSALNSSRDN